MHNSDVANRQPKVKVEDLYRRPEFEPQQPQPAPPAPARASAVPSHVSGFPKAAPPPAARGVSASTVASANSPPLRAIADDTTDFSADDGFSFSQDDSFFSQIDESELMMADVKRET